MSSSLYQARYWIGAAALSGVALVWYWQSGEVAPEPVSKPAAPAWYDSIGPGKMTGGPRQSTELAVDDQLAPSQLATDAAGNLVVDLPLRMLFEFFLVRGEGADLDARAGQLRAHLDRQVSGAANAQAKSLADRYVAYVRAYDDLLARQRIALAAGVAPSTPQVEQLAIWQQQRARLRQSTFGPVMANLWFGSDDAELAQAVASLRERGDPAADAGDADADSNTLRERRIHGATRDAARNNDNAELLERATKSYQAAVGEEREWRAHFLRYRAEAGQVVAAPGSEQRRMDLETLRSRIFPTERERIRARASGIE